MGQVRTRTKERDEESCHWLRRAARTRAVKKWQKRLAERAQIWSGSLRNASSIVLANPELERSCPSESESVTLTGP